MSNVDLRFFSDRGNNVDMAIDGFMQSSKVGSLRRSEAGSHTRFVVRSDWKKDKVALVSGGGSGHEPGHVGYVGKGMLTAAVCGEVFASPSVEAVLATIIAVTGEAGCLLIIKSYTGDRLNFGLAAERAKKLGYKVEMLIVEDDVSIENASRPRGIAGAVLAHKITGAMAESGFTLEQIAESSRRLMKGVFTIGMALSTCALPGQDYPNPRQCPELGLGIHGEPGAKKMDVVSKDELVPTLLTEIGKYVKENTRYIALVNNLGAVSELEMSIINQQILQSPVGQSVDYIIGPSAMLTAIDMYGFSLTLVPVSSELLLLLDMDVEPQSWPGCKKVAASEAISTEGFPLRFEYKSSENEFVGNILDAVVNELLASEKYLNDIDALIGDGDTGTTFANAGRAIKAQLEEGRLPLNDTPSLFLALGQILSNAMGGSSGVLLSIMTTRIGSELANGMSLGEAFEAGVAAISEYGGAKLGDRTMYDALQPAAEAFNKVGLSEAVSAAREMADATRDILVAGAGRSAYLRTENLKGVIDPGADAVAKIIEVIYETSKRL